MDKSQKKRRLFGTPYKGWGGVVFSNELLTIYYIYHYILYFANEQHIDFSSVAIMGKAFRVDVANIIRTVSWRLKISFYFHGLHET